MKKINSITYGHKIILLAATFLVPVPSVCYLFGKLTEQPLFYRAMRTSLALGFAILLLLLIWLRIELFQDQKIDAFFTANRSTCQLLQQGLYECQSCGYNQIRPEQRSCTMCGTTFKKE